MQQPTPSRRATLAGLLAAAIPAPAARGQTALPTDLARWPDRPVRFINPFTPGSAVDVVARLIALDLSDRLGQQFIVENRTGASGNIGTEAAARSRPDGYTVLVGSPGTMAINPALFRSLPYDAVRDFSPVSHVASFPQVLVVNPSLPVRTLAEFVAYAKAHPGRLNYASSGSGSTNHLAMELIRNAFGIDLVHVPYRGGVVTMQALVAGDVQAGVEGILSLPAFLAAGTVRPLAVTSAARSPMLPEVPALAETLPGFDASAWVVFFAPRGTPEAVLDRLAAEMRASLERPGVRDKLAELGATPVGTTPAQAAAFHRAELEKWRRAVELSGARAD
jgi:tripartite-type tricarboxylate transporter receptor subunit TctC